jgi:hypothetical protein
MFIGRAAAALPEGIWELLIADVRLLIEKMGAFGSDEVDNNVENLPVIRTGRRLTLNGVGSETGWEFLSRLE